MKCLGGNKHLHHFLSPKLFRVRAGMNPAPGVGHQMPPPGYILEDGKVYSDLFPRETEKGHIYKRAIPPNLDNIKEKELTG